MSNSVIAVDVKEISKSFGNKALFENFSLQIKEKSVHAIIGANGAGKTTLLRLLTKLYDIDSGEVFIKGSHSMLLENDYLYEDKNGLENIKIFGMYFGYSLDGYERYSDLLQLTEHIGKRVSSYSKGMKRKLSLLVVILMNKDVIYLDEPTSGVDPISRVEIRKIIDQLKSEGKTLIITSHDLSEIEKIADEISMIKDGQLILKLEHKDIEGKSLEELFLRAGNRQEDSYEKSK